MTGKIFLIAAVVSICDASVIPLTPTWGSPATPCSRTCRRSSSSGRPVLESCSSGIDYNYLFSLLYPGLALDSLDDATLNYLESYVDGPACNPSDYYVGLCSDCLGGCGRYGCRRRELCCNGRRGCVDCLGDCCGDCYGKCSRGCCGASTGCIGRCRTGCYCSRCSPYNCKKAGRCYSCPITYG